MAKTRRRKQKKADPSGPSGRDDLVRDAGGLDWGWPRLEAIAANMELAQRLGQGGFAGCGYGLTSVSGPPFLALVGSNDARMRSALKLMREWTDLDGPNAIRLEIMLEPQSYVISISQQPDLLRWRLRGLDNTEDPIVILTSLAKRLDTRNPFLEDLAAYCRKPIAPVLLTVASVPESQIVGHHVTHPSGFAPVIDGGILLPGIDVFRSGETRPRYSMMIDPGAGDRPPPGSSAWPPEPATDAESVARQRERRLLAALPKTLHALRYSSAGRLLKNAHDGAGWADWQIEQAVCNLRSADWLAYEPKGKAKRFAMIDELRRNIVEPASTPVDFTALAADQVDYQADLDLAFLLRRLDEDTPLPSTREGRQAKLGALGYG